MNRNGRETPQPAEKTTHTNLEAILAAVPGAVVLLDQNDVVLSANGDAAQILCCRKENLAGKPFASLLKAHDAQAALSPDTTSRWSGMRQDGAKSMIQVKVGAFELGADSFKVAALSEIASATAVELALLDSEHSLRQLIEGLPQLVWTCTTEGSCDYLSPQWVAYTGIAEQDQLNSGWMEQIHEADRAGVAATWSKSVETGQPFQFAYRIRRFDGQYRWFDGRAIPLRNVSMTVVKWFGSSTDIHESCETSAALERERRTLANLVAMSPAVFCSFCLQPDGHSYFPFSSPGIFELAGVSADDLKKDAVHVFNLFHPDDLEPVNSSIGQSAEKMTTWQAQFRIRHPLKGERWMEGQFTPAKSQEGVVWHGFLTDITERRQVEADQDFLLRLGARLQSASVPGEITKLAAEMLVEHFRVMRCSLASVSLSRNQATILHETTNGISAPTGTIYPLTSFATSRVLAMLASGKSLVIEDTASDLLTAEFHERTYQPLGMSALLSVPLRREGVWVAALTLSVDKPKTWSQREINLARAASDRLWPAYETARALEAERATNESLTISEERLRLALQSGAIGIWEVNHVTGRRHWDQRSRSIFEFAPNVKITAEDFLLRVHPDDQAEVQSASEELANPHGSDHFRFVYRIKVNRGGGICYVLARGRTFFGGEGDERRAIRSVGTIQDITEHKLFEAKLERSLQEKQTLLQEVHHRVKNNLQIISSLLSMQANLIEDKSAVAKLIDSDRRVRSMAMIHEHLYHQKDMSSIDLGEYLKDLTAELFSSSVGNQLLRFRVEATSVSIPIDQAIPCGLMLNELITNALKYAYPEGEGEICIKLVSDENSIAISVSDSGVGLPAGFDCGNSQSLGMTIIHVLTQQLEGELTISGSPGVTFTIRFPNIKTGRHPNELLPVPPKKAHVAI